MRRWRPSRSSEAESGETDEAVEGLRYVAQLLGEEQRAVRALEALLPGTTKPYAGSAAFRELTGPAGVPRPTRDRVSCCLFHTVRPEDTCASRRRTCDADRARKLSAVAAS